MTDKDQHVTIIPPSGLYRAGKWQVIETAPMDGTEVLLFFANYSETGCVTAGYFVNKNAWYEAHWYSDRINAGASPPTHWMPLPLPPQHDSDCALHNAPALPKTDCDCSMARD